MTTESENANNPYHRTAASYEKKLNLPFVRTIRKSEQRKLTALFDTLINAQDTVLEIGCGTGYYTRDLVKRASSVIALDDSATMLEIVRNRLSEEDRGRVTFVRSEATQYSPEGAIDIVMHLGVLDYVRDWKPFLAHSLANAGRAVIFTCPTTYLFGQVFHLLSRFEGVRIQRYNRGQIEQYISENHPDWSCNMELAGFNSHWSGAMTWVVALTRIT